MSILQHAEPSPMTHYEDERADHQTHRGFKLKPAWIVAGVVALAFLGALLFGVWTAAGRPDMAVLQETVTHFLQLIKTSPFSFPLTVLVFMVGGVVFFPVTVLSMATILVFGGVTGFFYGMAGAMASSLVGYGLGSLIGRRRLERTFGKAKGITKKLSRGGVINVILVRMMPAPFSLGNMLFGAVRMPVLTFFAGSTLSMLPGKVMMAFFGTSLLKLIENPRPGQLAQVAVLLVSWLVMIALCQHFGRKWQKDHPDA